MGWFTRKFDSWASKKQRTEMADFIARLRSMDSSEIGHVVACATHLRHQLEAEGHIPIDPINYVAINPMFPLLLSRTTIGFQKQGRLQDAAALMVWLHTARAGVRLELRFLGRELWKELERGFPYVEEAADNVKVLFGKQLDISEATTFPFGLTPEPL